MLEIKPLPTTTQLEDVRAFAARCRVTGEPEVAESACLDILAADPDDRPTRELLVLARIDLLDRGLPGGVDRACEALAPLPDAYDRAYLGGLIRERQARYLLRQRGHHAGFVAHDWLRTALQDYETAMQERRDRPEPVVRFNACVRLLDANPHCRPAPDERPDYAIE